MRSTMSGHRALPVASTYERTCSADPGARNRIFDQAATPAEPAIHLPVVAPETTNSIR